MSETGELRLDSQEWLRLDRKMLLIGPARALKEMAIPLIIAFVGLASRDSGNALWVIPGALGLVVIGWVPWFTTYFRITPTQLQLRKGLINKEQLTAPLDRIRSVDLESSLLHRALGLSKVEIGTGVDDTRIELNALAETDAQALRVLLLTKGGVGADAATSTAESSTDAAVDAAVDAVHRAAPAPQAPQRALEPAIELAAIDWTWLRFAPFSLGRLVILAGIFGLVAQFGDNVPIFNWDNVDSGWERIRTFALPVIIIVTFISILMAWLVVSIGGYVVQWWELRLVRDNGSLRLTAGLLTTRSTSIEEERIRGVELIEPVLLRLVGGAELSTLATGVGEGGATKVLPPCPRAVATSVGERILDIRDPELSEPLSVPADATRPGGAPALSRSSPVAHHRGRRVRESRDVRPVAGLVADPGRRRDRVCIARTRRRLLGLPPPGSRPHRRTSRRRIRHARAPSHRPRERRRDRLGGQAIALPATGWAGHVDRHHRRRRRRGAGPRHSAPSRHRSSPIGPPREYSRRFSPANPSPTQGARIMQTAHGTMATDRPERYAKQLVSHWSKHGPVTTQDGVIVQQWDTGQILTFRPAEGVLNIEVSVPDDADVTQFAEVVERHLVRFGTREELAVVWAD